MGHLAPLLPQNAPFSSAERAWINGFLAGLLEPGAEIDLPNPAALAVATPAARATEDAPWHDPTLPLEERLALAEGAPRARRLMAAMAQQDCGQCGYLCKSYAEAIDRGEETSLTRCVPGGKETSRALKELVAEKVGPAVAAAPSRAPAVSPAPPAGAARAVATFAGAARLSRLGSEKDTRHVVFRLKGPGLGYEVGDSLAVSVENCPELVDAVMAALNASPEQEVVCPDGVARPLRDALSAACEIARPSDTAVEVLASRATGPGESDRLQALAEGYPGAEPVEADLLELLETFPSARPPLQELISSLGALQPRLYSLASSPKWCADEVHLTVDTVRYEKRGRARKGVASTFLTERAAPGREIAVAVQPSHGFRLARPDVPIVMIGPGTGVAPFRAFLQERRATSANGRNWLFFGAQRRALDFLYEEELEEFHRDGLLTRIDTAFSRDQSQKIYVQHRMREAAAELWSWLQDGAHVYVCGDAQCMARDVDTALALLIAKQGRMEWGDAKAHLAALAREGRYQRDVY